MKLQKEKFNSLKNDIINNLDDDMNQCGECGKWINYYINTIVLRHSQEYFCLDCYYEFMGYGKNQKVDN